MPKGKPESSPAPPELAPCDFCTSQHTPLRWNSRTCPSCTSAGLPDQSLVTWDTYMARLPNRKPRANRKPRP